MAHTQGSCKRGEEGRKVSLMGESNTDCTRGFLLFGLAGIFRDFATTWPLPGLFPKAEEFFPLLPYMYDYFHGRKPIE